MFSNIGGKIKALAKVICWLGIIASIFVGLLFLDKNPLGGLLWMVLGSLSSWIGSFVLYGFGQLVENSDIHTEILADIADEISKPDTVGDRITTLHKRGLISDEDYSFLTRDPISQFPSKNTASIKSATGTFCTQNKESDPAVGTATKDKPIQAPVVDGQIVCPVCKTTQKADRKVCWSCGQRFEK